MKRFIRTSTLGAWMLAYLTINYANAGFIYDPINVPILSASFSADFAELVAHRTIAGFELNKVMLMGQGNDSALDLSDDFFGTAELLLGETATINQAPLETGIFSVSIPASFFPKLQTGKVGLWFLATDTDDGLFAMDFLSLSIQTADGTVESFIDTNNGFGIGLADGEALPSPLPTSLPIGATGIGFDESISSKNIHNVIPESSTMSLFGIGLLGLLFGHHLPKVRKRRAVRTTLFATCLLAITSLESKAIVELMDLDQILAEADSIMEGTVVELRGEASGDGTQIFSFVTISVDRVLRGAAWSNPLTLRILGGEAGEITMLIPEGPDFDVGQDIIIFLTPNQQALFPIVGLAQGLFTVFVDPGTGQEMATNFQGITLPKTDLLDAIEEGTP